MRATDRLPFREGVVVNRPVKDGNGSLVNVGLQKEVSIDKRLKPGTRVTVKLTYNGKKCKHLILWKCIYSNQRSCELTGIEITLVPTLVRLQ